MTDPPSLHPRRGPLPATPGVGRPRLHPRPELGDILNGRLVAAPPYTHPTLRKLYVLMQCLACGAFARTSDTNARRYGCRCREWKAPGIRKTEASS